MHYYLIDYYKYGKSYNYFGKGIHEGTVKGEHLVGTGYLLTAYQFCTYIDWIIKNNMDDFNKVAYVGEQQNPLWKQIESIEEDMTALDERVSALDERVSALESNGEES